MADIPAGTGLGSSGSFTTALLKALHAHRKHLVHPEELAEQACQIEIEKLGEPIGKQDQYIAAYGGITCFRFLPNGKVEAWPLKIDAGHALRPRRQPAAVLHRLLAVGVGHPPGAGRQEQGQRQGHGRQPALHQGLGRESKEALEAGDLHRFGELMNVHWEHKKQRSANMSNPHINEWYDLARAERRGRWQADRRGRRRLPDVLRGGQGAAAQGACARPACRRCASASTSKAPPS